MKKTLFVEGLFKTTRSILRYSNYILTATCKKLQPLFFLDYSANVYSTETMGASYHTVELLVWAFPIGF